MAWTTCRRARMAELGRIARDVAAGFVAFLLLAVAMGGEASHAAPYTAAAQAGGTGPASAYALLALVFSAVVAFNLAFLRHLVRVYTSPSRGAWRREIGSDRGRQGAPPPLY